MDYEKRNKIFFQTKVNSLIDSKNNIREEGNWVLNPITKNLKEIQPDELKELKELVSEYLIDGVNNYSDKPFNWIEEDVVTTVSINKNLIFKAKIIYTFSSTILELSTTSKGSTANTVETFENNITNHEWNDKVIEIFVNQYLLKSRCAAAAI